MKKKYIVLITLLLVSMMMIGCGNNKSICTADKCKNECVEETSYCIEHKCLEDGCLELRTRNNYCEEHYKCSECRTERNAGSDYCFMHECSEPGCSEQKIVGLGYCKQHYNLNGQKMAGEEEQAQQKKYQEDKDAKKDTVIIDSNGKKIWKVYMADDEFKINAEYRGTGNFIITLLDDNQDFYAMICNEIGDYIVDKKIPVIEGECFYIETFCSDGSWSGTWSGTYGE